MKLFAVAALAVGINNAFADGGVKAAVLDTGKGGTRLTVSVPDFADGPYDFAKNPGVGKSADSVWNHQEVMFNAALGESGVVVYQATLERIYPAKTSKRLSTESLAKGMIKAAGFEDRAEQINCPPVQIEGAKTACYKMSGNAVFDGEPMKEKFAEVLAVVSFANDTQAYMLKGTVVERNVAKFNADPTETKSLASKALSQIWKNLKVEQQ